MFLLSLQPCDKYLSANSQDICHIHCPFITLDTSVSSALETFVIIALYKSTFTIPYRTQDRFHFASSVQQWMGATVLVCATWKWFCSRISVCQLLCGFQLRDYHSHDVHTPLLLQQRHTAQSTEWCWYYAVWLVCWSCVCEVLWTCQTFISVTWY